MAHRQSFNTLNCVGTPVNPISRSLICVLASKKLIRQISGFYVLKQLLQKNFQGDCCDIFLGG
jgi:hypothetical protein